MFYYHRNQDFQFIYQIYLKALNKINNYYGSICNYPIIYTLFKSFQNLTIWIFRYLIYISVLILISLLYFLFFFLTFLVLFLLWVNWWILLLVIFFLLFSPLLITYIPAFAITFLITQIWLGMIINWARLIIGLILYKLTIDLIIMNRLLMCKFLRILLS